MTQNTRHFPEKCLTEHELLCRTPDDFLIHQFHLNPGLVLDKIDAQTSAIRRERTALLNVLKLTVPKFARLLEERNG